MNSQQEWQHKTDQELVRMAKSDPDCFGIIMERYKEPLARYIRRISYFSEEDIEDLLQEIFVKIYRSLNDYDESLKFSSWIYRIAHNHVIDQFRKANSKLATTSLEENELSNFLRSAVNLEKEAAVKDCLNKVKAAIQELPVKYREILVLRFLEEKDYEEIMDILQKPKGTVATLINRGRALLKKKLDKVNINCL